MIRTVATPTQAPTGWVRRTWAAGLTLVSVAALVTGCAGAGEAACSMNLQVTDLATSTQTSLTHGAAVSFVNGAAYTAFASDQPFDASEISLTTAPTAADGAVMASLFVTRFNVTSEVQPIEVGAVVTPDAPEGDLVFGVVIQRGTVVQGNALEGTGTLTVRSVGESLCFDIDYRDSEKQVSGTFAGDAVALM